MEFKIKDLLNDALNRANIKKSVEAAQIVKLANEIIIQKLPNNRSLDAVAVSYKDGVLLINCLNGPVSQYIKNQEAEVIQFLKRKMPQIDIQRIQTRIVIK